MMFNGRKNSGARRTKASVECSKGSKMEHSTSSSRPASGLLDMLAEIASQTLHSDPTVKTSPVKKKTLERLMYRDSKDKTEIKEPTRKKQTEVDTLTAAKLRSLSLSQQLRLCSRLDGDEMRRTFTYTCLLEPELCGQTFSSFGSEGRARQMMRLHLLEHLKNHGPDEPIHVSRRRRTPKVQNVKKKVNPKVKVEPVRSARFRYSELYDEVNNLPVNNKENKGEGTGEWRASGDKSQQKLQSLNLLKKVDASVPTSVQVPQSQVSLSTQQSTAESDEETISCCSTGSRFNDLTPPGSPSQGSNAVVNGNSLEAEADTDISIYTEHSYTSRGTDSSSGGMRGNGSIAEVSRMLIKTESGVECTLDPAEFFIDVNSKRLPPVGREVDIKTETTSMKTIKSAAKLKDIIKSLVHKLKEDLPVLCDNRREPASNDFGGRDSRELRWETTAVERDEFYQHKKPKGKAKFIGQSKAEKEMAIRLINAIKTKASPAGLQSLDTLECRICRPPRCFTAPTTLMSHYRSHAGIKPYECRICRAAFTRQHSLNYHMLIHSNQTRFTCHDCGRKFRHPSHFKEHRRRHTGESPFECSDCLLRFKTRNTYKRHLKTRHGKVLTTSGGLIILSEEEFKRVRTMPRSPNSIQASQNSGSVSKAGGDAESDEDDEEEEEYSSSGAEEIAETAHATLDQPVKVEVIETIPEIIENCIEEETMSETTTAEESDRSPNLNDIVCEAMRQSEITFASAEDERNVNVDNSGATIKWSVEENAFCPNSNDTYPTAVLKISKKDMGKSMKMIPLSAVGIKRPTTSNEDLPSKSAKLEKEPGAGNTENLATILSGQNAGAIPQSLALLQSRYLVGSQSGLSVIGSDSQQATVLLLANQHLRSRQSQSETISLMLA